jgi:1,4-alpha-glucan branching enzyme
MPGDRWQQFANLRAYFAFMWTHPGKKLLFMGDEFGQEREWDHDRGPDWYSLDDPMHASVQLALRDLNHLYREIPALHSKDCVPDGFAWVILDDAHQSILGYFRFASAGDTVLLVVCNFTPVPRYDYRVGVPHSGEWREIFNSDAKIYGGSNIGNGGRRLAETLPSHGQPFSLNLVIPPLATIMFEGMPTEASVG